MVTRDEGAPLSRSRVASRRVALGTCSAVRVTCGTRPAREAKSGRAQTVLAETSECGCAARRRPRGPKSEGQKQTSGVLLGFPFGDAEKRSGLRGRRRGLSEPPQGASSAATEDCEHRRGVPALERRNRHRRGRLLLATFLGEARKVARRSRNKNSIGKQNLNSSAFATTSMNGGHS